MDFLELRGFKYAAEKQGIPSRRRSVRYNVEGGIVVLHKYAILVFGVGLKGDEGQFLLRSLFPNRGIGFLFSFSIIERYYCEFRLRIILSFAEE